MRILLETACLLVLVSLHYLRTQFVVSLEEIFKVVEENRQTIYLCLNLRIGLFAYLRKSLKCV